MAHVNLYAELLVNVLGKVLGTVNGTVLASRAAEAEHQVGEAALDVSSNVLVGEHVYVVKEIEYLAIVFKESYHWLVEASQLLVRLVSPGVMR